MTGRSAQALRRLRVAAAVLVAPLLFAACSGGSKATDTKPTESVAQISISVPNGAEKVEPSTKVKVTVKNGKLKAVTVADKEGKPVEGELSADGTAWTTTSSLDLGTDYTAEAVAVDQHGLTKTAKSVFETVEADKTLRFEPVPGRGQTVGVGQPIAITFKTKIKDRKAVQDALVVETTPRVEGAWYWVDSKSVHWRPKDYWPAGTKVTVKANLKGVKAAPGVYGAKNVSYSFNISKNANILKIDLKNTHRMQVYRNGELLKTIPVTGGKPGWDTRSGIKVIMTKEPSHRMRSSTVGVANPESLDYYDLDVKYALRVTWSGEFLHQAEWSVGDQGRRNVSHGCVGMSPANARWLFNIVQIGDPVEVIGTKPSKKMELTNGFGDWNIPWEVWSKGNAEGSESVG
ncbi:hypothetical protein C3Y87_05370 [Carbonactinospora thermoautotrophica]|nr:Ig-like domain-containing protein [Carbonactinospora thermoautotrophica]MCX9190850.1 hypothetical protein [Carbonactinospora thermoautotrophica]